MRKLFIMLIITLPLISMAQLKFAWQLNANYPIDFSSGEIIRKMGAESQFSIMKNVNDSYRFEFGLLVDSHGRIKYGVNERSALTFQLYVPLMLNRSFNNGKFMVKSGVLLAARNIFTFAKYTADYNTNGMIEPDNEYYPQFRSFGFDFGIGAEYMLSDKFNMIINYHMPFNLEKQEYGVLSCGLKYKLNYQ